MMYDVKAVPKVKKDAALTNVMMSMTSGRWALQQWLTTQTT